MQSFQTCIDARATGAKLAHSRADAFPDAPRTARQGRMLRELRDFGIETHGLHVFVRVLAGLALGAAFLVASTTARAGDGSSQSGVSNLPAAQTEDTFMDSSAEAFAAGMNAYERGDFGQAAVHLFSAAIRDHAQAQEILGFMRLYGAGLYGGRVARDRDEAIFWLGAAARQGRGPAQQAYCKLIAASRDLAQSRTPNQPGCTTG